jgi:hypothetical protein
MARGSASYTQAAAGTLAAYKACYQTISNVINQAGVRTADTGQVNWATIPSEPSSLGRDYEVFALGGPLQATAPIFLRFDYAGYGVAGTYGVHITVGTTTDGAGTLGGLTVARLPLQNHAIGTPPVQWCWAASDQASYFTFLYALDTAATGQDGVGMVVVERTRDPNGDANGVGFHVWRWQAFSLTTTTNAGGWSRTFGAGSQPAVADFCYNAMVPDLQNNTSASQPGGLFYAFPAYTWTPPAIMGGASKALMFAYPPDFPRGSATPVTHYGESMTFIPLGDVIITGQPAMTSNTVAAVKYMAPMIRWD